MLLKVAKTIRTCTTASIMATIMLAVIYVTKPQIYGEVRNMIVAFLFLGLFPILAYPLQKYIPQYKDKGRDGQRNLAMIFSVFGYILGCSINLFFNAPLEMWIIYLGYLISGVCILLINKLFHLRASGHACGVAGPIMLLIVFGVPALIPGVVLLIIVWWASLIMKRHTFAQLVGGTAIPLIAVAILNAILR